MRQNKIPKKLQSVLWSVNVGKLNIGNDKGYIIHQILSYGMLDEIRWLFQTYPKEEIKRIFRQLPYKDYRASRFFFVKDYLLGLTSFSPDERLYVKNTPRRIG